MFGLPKALCPPPHGVLLAYFYSAARPVAYIAGYVCAPVELLAQLCCMLRIFHKAYKLPATFLEQVWAMRVKLNLRCAFRMNKEDL